MANKENKDRRYKGFPGWTDEMDQNLVSLRSMLQIIDGKQLTATETIKRGLELALTVSKEAASATLAKDGHVNHL